MKHHPNRKAQILKFATEYFGRDGYDKVTVKQLADSCGITEPAVYRHYKCKEAIYDAVLGSLESRLDYKSIFSELEKETDLETLLSKLSHHIITFFSKNIEIYRLLLYAVLRGHEHARNIFNTVRGTYVRFLKDQLDRLYLEGIITKKQNEITARCFIGTVFDCALSASLYKGLLGSNYEPDQIVANNVPIFARGLKK